VYFLTILFYICTLAIRHNKAGKGNINIHVDENIFSISNTGKTDSINADKIFRRFSRTSEEKKGNGPGLSIVRQVCKFHGWNIEYKDTLHVFVIKFDQA
ncbi:MAG TPA: two-component sensor histidine kinase, partial [Porphyromonadaceae bacterium]|nr:two-component sensor histidine kinase [Porphyromonadaceae bacterium]